MTAGVGAALWDFALRVYTTEGVAPACLALQDEDGIDVNVLLFSAWAGAERGLALERQELQRLVREVAPWQHEVVQPLRAVRRRLKEGPPPTPDERTAALRKRIQEVEIEAERIELLRLAELAGSGAAAGEPDARLAAAARNTPTYHPLAGAQAAPEASLATLLRATFPDSEPSEVSAALAAATHPRRSQET